MRAAFIYRRVLTSHFISDSNAYIFFTDKHDKLYTSRRQLSYPKGAYREGLIGYILYTRLK